MSSSVFKLDVAGKRLQPLQRCSMSDEKLCEAYDLETWLASSREGLFGRDVLWIARQDRPSEEQRSDLVGVDSGGDLLITELKCGTVTEDAVTQALGYAAEYAEKSVDDLVSLFLSQSQKGGSTGLLARATSAEEAQSLLNDHVGEDTEVNEIQTILLVGEEFTPKPLAICDFLNRSSTNASYSIECWRYGVCKGEAESRYFVLEQILPPPSVRDEIEKKREARRERKYARDPRLKEFMRKLVSGIDDGQVSAFRKGGQSYRCQLRNSAWPKDADVRLRIDEGWPQIILPDGMGLRDPASVGATEGMRNDRRTLEFKDVEVGPDAFTTSVRDRLRTAIRSIRVQLDDDSATKPTPAPTAPQAVGARRR